jgi:hypothetical protein
MAAKKGVARKSKSTSAKKSAGPVASKAKKSKPAAAKSSTSTLSGKSPSALIDGRIEELSDWRGEMLSHLRSLIKEADPDVVETWKWMGTPVWEDHGIICTGETYKKVVKLTFAKGASVSDPTGMFNSSLEGNTRRAIDFPEDAAVDAKAFKALIRAAVAHNKVKPAKR